MQGGVSGADVNAQDSEGRTVSHVSIDVVTRRNFPFRFWIVEMLLEAGASVDIPDQKGVTALQYASDGVVQRKRISMDRNEFFEWYDSTLNLMSALTTRGADKRTPLPAYDNMKDLINRNLLIAENYGLVRLAEAALTRGADPNYTGPDGDAPLIAAARNGNIDIVNALIKAQADTSYRNQDEQDPAVWPQ